MTTYYVDIGVVRIQEYINRTSGSDGHVLRRRRGASRMVADVTRVESVIATFADETGALHESWQLGRNTETYDTEGVAHLKLVAGASADRTVQEVVAVLLGQVRHGAPQAYLRASWAQAESYARALPLLKAALRGEHPAEAGASDVLPPARDEVLSARCTSCGRAPASLGEYCQDCVRREQLGSRGIDDATLSPQDEALVTLSNQWPKIVQAGDLSKLARLPGRTAPGQGGSGKLNHLATIYADGNNVGALFRSISGDLDRAKVVSAALNRTTKSSGHAALADLLSAIYGPAPTPGPYVLPGEVTTLAADDVLITVPASYGWRFVLTLVDSFNEAIARELGDSFNQSMPSLTAGITFHHCKLPIEEAVSTAFGVMRQAKDACRGTQSAIGWADLTAADPVRTREFTWFRDHNDDLSKVAGMPHSQAAKYRQFLIQLNDRDPAQVHDFLRQESNRDGAGRWIGSILDSHPAQPEAALEHLGDALNLAAWFPQEPGEDE